MRSRKIKNDKDILTYLPDYSKKKTPNREFLVNIINTLYPGVIKKLVMKLKSKKIKKREAKLKKYVIIKESYAE